jgi:hypothetical protein
MNNTSIQIPFLLLLWISCSNSFEENNQDKSLQKLLASDEKAHKQVEELLSIVELKLNNIKSISFNEELEQLDNILINLNTNRLNLDSNQLIELAFAIEEVENKNFNSNIEVNIANNLYNQIEDLTIKITNIIKKHTELQTHIERLQSLNNQAKNQIIQLKISSNSIIYKRDEIINKHKISLSSIRQEIKKCLNEQDKLNILLNNIKQCDTLECLIDLNYEQAVNTKLLSSNLALLQKNAFIIREKINTGLKSVREHHKKAVIIDDFKKLINNFHINDDGLLINYGSLKKQEIILKIEHILQPYIYAIINLSEIDANTLVSKKIRTNYDILSLKIKNDLQVNFYNEFTQSKKFLIKNIKHCISKIPIKPKDQIIQKKLDASIVLLIGHKITYIKKLLKIAYNKNEINTLIEALNSLYLEEFNYLRYSLSNLSNCYSLKLFKDLHDEVNNFAKDNFSSLKSDNLANQLLDISKQLEKIIK